MLIPYFTIAQNFGKNPYGSFNFMNTTGYNFRTDNTRTESFFSSFHLDFEVAKTFYPLIELNWRVYTRSGGNEPLNFDGSDLANFGSEHVAGLNELTLALGFRYKSTTTSHSVSPANQHASQRRRPALDEFRLTTDVIFRY